MDIPPKLFVTLPPAPPSLDMVTTKKYIEKPPAPRPEGDDEVSTNNDPFTWGVFGFGFGAMLVHVIWVIVMIVTNGN